VGTTVQRSPYSVTATASGGTPPYCMTVGGSGPNAQVSPSTSGCGYSSVSISGAFDQCGESFSFTVTVTDQNKQTASQTYSGSDPCPPPTGN
jgi:hypothetical protein